MLLGPPASGKGTQAELIATAYGLPSASTGALMRAQRARGSALGRAVDAATTSGRFFSDEIALAVVREWLAEHGEDGWLLDGFPRTLGQALAFDAEFSPPDVVLHLDLPAAVSRERVLHRITCVHCGATYRAGADAVREGDDCPTCGRTLERRADDSSTVLEERLTQHHTLTGPVLAHYRAAGRLVEIDAAADRDTVFAEIRSVLEEVPA